MLFFRYLKPEESGPGLLFEAMENNFRLVSPDHLPVVGRSNARHTRGFTTRRDVERMIAILEAVTRYFKRRRNGPIRLRSTASGSAFLAARP